MSHIDAVDERNRSFPGMTTFRGQKTTNFYQSLSVAVYTHAPQPWTFPDFTQLRGQWELLSQDQLDRTLQQSLTWHVKPHCARASAEHTIFCCVIHVRNSGKYPEVMWTGKKVVWLKKKAFLGHCGHCLTFRFPVISQHFGSYPLFRDAPGVRGDACVCSFSQQQNIWCALLRHFRVRGNRSSSSE